MSYVCGRCNAPIFSTQGKLEDHGERARIELEKTEIRNQVREMAYTITRWFKGRDLYGIAPFPGTQRIEMPESFEFGNMKTEMDRIKRIIRSANYNNDIKDMHTGKPSDGGIQSEFEPLCFMARYDTGFKGVVVKYVMVTLKKHWDGSDRRHVYNIELRPFSEHEEKSAENTWERGNKNVYY